MLFTRILLGLELDHLLAHLAVLEQQHLPDCQERSLGRKSWRKLVLVATKRRREAIKRNFSQPASLTSYSGENFGAEILLTAAGQNWAKWQSKGLVLIDKKWKRCDTNGPNLERYLEHEVWIEVQKLLFQGLPTSYFSTVNGTDQWPRNIRHGIWNILWKTQPYNFYKHLKKCCHRYSLNIIQCATTIPTNIDNSSIKCRFFVSGSGKQIQYSAFYTFTASGVIGSLSDQSKSTIFQQEARSCYDLLIYHHN